MNVVICSVKEAFELMRHRKDGDVVLVSVFDKQSNIHDITKKIKKEKN